MEKSIKETRGGIRNSNVELLRIVLMLFIILWHCIVHLLGYAGFADVNSYNPIILILMSFSVIGVNAFVSVSAIWGIKFKMKTIIAFIFQALFYSLTIFGVFYFFIGKEYIETNLISSFFPIITEQWWFLSVYLVLFMLAPIINMGIEKLNRKELKLIILVMLAFEVLSPIFRVSSFGSNGYNIYSFILIYLIVRYIFLYDVILTIRNNIYLYSCCSLLTFIIVASLLYIHPSAKLNNFAWHMFDYSQLLILIASISFVCLFKQIKIKNSKWINEVASLTFGIYLIHDHRTIRKFLKSIFQPLLNSIDNTLILIVCLLIIAMLIFIVCGFVEKIRKMISEPIVDWISLKLDKLIRFI